MSQVELSDALFAKLAGWEAVKQARNLLASDRVLSSDWQPPLLKGMVQEGSTTYRAGLVIKHASDADNLCTCRQARQYGVICAHSVAVGLHWLKATAPPAIPQRAAGVSPAVPAASSVATKPIKRLHRAAENEVGEALELYVILPPNFAPAAAKGRVTICFEAKCAKGRVPLNTLSLSTPFTVAAEDAPLLEQIETLAESGPPAMLMLSANQFVELLPKLIGHPRVTLGKSQSLTISNQPWAVPLKASLLETGEIVLKLNASAPPGLIRGATAWVFNGAPSIARHDERLMRFVATEESDGTAGETPAAR